MSRSARLIFCVVAAAASVGCDSRAPRPDAHIGGCAHNRELPPLQLTPEQERLLASVTPSPRTALDYYMLLPKSDFRILPDSRERRVTYLDAQTLSDDFLHASHWFECDGGGFEVTLKLYHTPTGTFVALKHGHDETIFDDGKPSEGEPYVSTERPTLWRYSDGEWSRQPDESVPKISAQRVLTKYHHDWDADQQYTDQQKTIWIDYVLSPSTDDVVLMGRENFQPDAYEYGRLKWRDTHLSFK